MTRPRCRAGARSASRRSRTPARSIRSAWKRSTTRSATSRSTSWTRRRRTASRSSSGSTRRACTSSRISRRKYEAMRNSENGWSEEEAGMAQLDDDIGLVMKKLKDMGEDDNTIVVFTTDNGTEVFTWPDGGQTPFAQSKGTVMEGGFRVPALLRWPGHVPADSVQNGIFSGLDWFPTFLAAAGNPKHHRRIAEGQEDRRPDLQEPSRRLQPDGRDHRQGAVRASRDLLSRRKHGRRGAHRRLQVSLHRSARRLAG